MTKRKERKLRSSATVTLPTDMWLKLEDEAEHTISRYIEEILEGHFEKKKRHRKLL